MALSDKWQKSTRSAAGGDCVEACTTDGVVHVRDSKNPDSGTLSLSQGAWRSLLGAVKAGELDL